MLPLYFPLPATHERQHLPQPDLITYLASLFLFFFRPLISKHTWKQKDGAEEEWEDMDPVANSKHKQTTITASHPQLVLLLRAEIRKDQGVKRFKSST